MSDNVRPDRARRFAVWIVQKLHDAGFEALWAGGCVRDELLGLVPHDYDVATNATPDEVRSCFGTRRTLAIGAAFGVVTVLGGREEGQIEVATFRCDAAYSDGRRPDSVSFSTAREDALRRDFTVNGMFYNPLTHEVIDYVGGRRDLEAGVVRAIGNPLERFAEDKLRMLRAARLASTFGFRVDPDTAGCRAGASGHDHDRECGTHCDGNEEDPGSSASARGARLLQEMRLLEALVPESRVLLDDHMAAAPPPTGDVGPRPAVADHAAHSRLRSSSRHFGLRWPHSCGACTCRTHSRHAWWARSVTAGDSRTTNGRVPCGSSRTNHWCVVPRRSPGRGSSAS